jgi:hypothetical protein
MLYARRFPWAVIACITVMIPNCECCFLLGIPFGVWGLIVLYQPNVRRAFDYRPPVEETPRSAPPEDVLED